MKNKELRKKTIIVILLIIVINVFSMLLWFKFRIKPIISMASEIKEEITTNELTDKYTTEKELLSDINDISNKYNR